MTERVTVSIADHVAVVALNRPEKHNALDMRMFEALADAGKRIADDASVRAVVLEGNGANFCAGIDTSIFAAGDSGISPESMLAGEDSPANFFQRVAYVWREVPVPVICAINGIAYGGGLQIAAGADIRFAGPAARLSIMEIKWGIMPDMAISTNLTRCMSADKLKELAWTGRIVDATEAMQLGLVTAVHEDPSQAARDTARGIAARSPDAIRAIKRLLDTAWQLSDADALKLEATLQMSLLGGPNQVEAVMANMEGREPRFADS